MLLGCSVPWGMACRVQRMGAIPGADEHPHFCTEARRGVSSQQHCAPPARGGTWAGDSGALLLVCLCLEEREKGKHVCAYICVIL